MRSATSWPGPDLDLTARARVREAAIDLFGSDGYDSVSIRRVADAATVSPALVIHHFESKEGLRQACDEHVLAFLRAKSDVSSIEAVLTGITAYGRYVARMVTAGTPAGDALFDRLLDHARTTVAEETHAGRMRPSADPESLARVLVIQSLAPLVLHAQLARLAGEQVLSAQTLLDLAEPTAEIYTHGLYRTSELIDSVSKARSR